MENLRLVSNNDSSRPKVSLRGVALKPNWQHLLDGKICVALDPGQDTSLTASAALALHLDFPLVADLSEAHTPEERALQILLRGAIIPLSSPSPICAQKLLEGVAIIWGSFMHDKDTLESSIFNALDQILDDEGQLEFAQSNGELVVWFSIRGHTYAGRMTRELAEELFDLQDHHL